MNTRKIAVVFAALLVLASASFARSKDVYYGKTPEMSTKSNYYQSPAQMAQPPKITPQTTRPEFDPSRPNANIGKQSNFPNNALTPPARNSRPPEPPINSVNTSNNNSSSNNVTNPDRHDPALDRHDMNADKHNAATDRHNDDTDYHNPASDRHDIEADKSSAN